MFTTFSFILIFRISYIYLHHSHPSPPLHFNPSRVSACLPLLIFSFYPHLFSSSSLCIVGENHSPSLNSHWLPQALHLRWVFKCSLSVLMCWLTGVVVMQVCFWLFHDVSNLLNVAIVVFFINCTFLSEKSISSTLSSVPDNLSSTWSILLPRLSTWVS